MAGGAVFSAEHVLAISWSVTGLIPHLVSNWVGIGAINHAVWRGCGSINDIVAAEAFHATQIFISYLMTQGAGDPINSSSMVGMFRAVKTVIQPRHRQAFNQRLGRGHGHVTGDAFLLDHLLEFRISGYLRAYLCLPDRVDARVRHHGGPPVTRHRDVLATLIDQPDMAERADAWSHEISCLKISKRTSRGRVQRQPYQFLGRLCASFACGGDGSGRGA